MLESPSVERRFIVQKDLEVDWVDGEFNILTPTQYDALKMKHKESNCGWIKGRNGVWKKREK